MDAQVRAIVTRITGERIIDSSDDLVEDLGLNDCTRIELACTLEDKFDISISGDAAAGFVTVGDVLKYMEQAVEV